MCWISCVLCSVSYVILFINDIRLVLNSLELLGQDLDRMSRIIVVNPCMGWDKVMYLLVIVYRGFNIISHGGKSCHYVPSCDYLSFIGVDHGVCKLGRFVWLLQCLCCISISLRVLSLGPVEISEVQLSCILNSWDNKSHDISGKFRCFLFVTIQ